jgi:hypothetical protein
MVLLVERADDYNERKLRMEAHPLDDSADQRTLFFPQMILVNCHQNLIHLLKKHFI